MPPLHALLLDFDGVIAHTAPIVKQALWRFFREREMAILEKDFEEYNFSTKSLEQVCGVLRDIYGIQLDVHDVRKQIWDTQVQLMQQGCEYDPSLMLLLEACKQRNIRVAIGSNSIAGRIEWILKTMHIEWYFDTIVGAHDVVGHKPDPDVWIECAHRLGISHASCLVVDDGYPGLIAAQKCTMKSVYYSRYSWVDNQCIDIADYHADNFHDIADILFQK